MERTTDEVVVAAVSEASGDELVAIGRQLAAADPEVYREACEILAELVERVKRRNATRVGSLGVRVAVARA